MGRLLLSFESKQQVDFILHLLNDFSKDLSNDERSEMKIYFNKACKHELDFWHSAYNYKQIL
jgi:thiaminase